MPKHRDYEYIIGLDIGTSKITAIVGKQSSNGQISVVGTGISPSSGLKNGVVVNIEETTHCIRRAIEEAELMSDCRVNTVHAGISGAHIASQDSSGAIPLVYQEVHEDDIQQVLRAARGVSIPADRVLLHAIPQVYSVDQQSNIANPIGMSGFRLESHVHLITMSKSAASNVQRCVEKSGLTVDRMVLQQIAASEAVLREDEKDLGVCLIDIGAGTTDVVVYVDGVIKHASSIELAGDKVTNDLATALRTTVVEANKIKINHGSALIQLADDEAMIPVASTVGGRTKDVTERSLSEVIEPLYDDLLTRVRNDLRSHGLEDFLNAGLVFTGGGSKIKGLLDLAEDVFHMPARIGTPQGLDGDQSNLSDPIYTTAIGLMKYGMTHDDLPDEPMPSDTQMIQGTEKIGKIKKWVSDNF